MTPTNDAPVTVEQAVENARWLIANDSDNGWTSIRQETLRILLEALTSAPAGDGVEDRDALAERLCTARFPTTVARHPDYYRVQLTEESRERWRVVADAALARPRAAVGERIEALEAALNLALFIIEATPPHDEAVGDYMVMAGVLRDHTAGNYLALVRERLSALQSPPAKVEP